VRLLGHSSAANPSLHPWHRAPGDQGRRGKSR
jgi:hypothetical protein